MRVVRAGALVLLAVLATVQVQALVGSLSSPGVYLKDFSQDYLLARALWDGVDTNLPIRTLAERYATPDGFLDKANPTPHPPAAGLFGLPFAAVPYIPAVSAWTLFELVCLATSVLLLVRATELPLRTSSALVASFLIVAWPPVALDLRLGQATVPLLALLAAAQLALLHRRSKLAGLLLGLSLLLKPLAWPWLLVLLRRRDWPALTATGGAVLLGYGVVALREGPQPLWEYFVHVLPNWNDGYLQEATNISPLRLGPALLPDQPVLAQMVLVVVVIAGLLLVWWAARPNRPLRNGLSVATAAAVVINPVVWLFYLVLALLPIAVALGVLRKNPNVPTAAALMTLVALPYLVYLVNVQPSLAYYLVGLLASLCTLILAVATQRADEAVVERPAVSAQSSLANRNQKKVCGPRLRK